MCASGAIGGGDPQTARASRTRVSIRRATRSGARDRGSGAFVSRTGPPPEASTTKTSSPPVDPTHERYPGPVERERRIPIDVRSADDDRRHARSPDRRSRCHRQRSRRRPRRSRPGRRAPGPGAAIRRSTMARAASRMRTTDECRVSRERAGVGARRIVSSIGIHLSGRSQAGRGGRVLPCGRSSDRAGRRGSWTRASASNQAVIRRSNSGVAGSRSSRVVMSAAVRSSGETGVGLERRAHGDDGPMESGPDRARRDAQDLGRLVEGQAEVVVQHEDRPLIGVEAAEAALDLIAVGEIEARVGLGGLQVPNVDRRCSRRRFERPASR